jgi:hypothetical protein
VDANSAAAHLVLSSRCLAAEGGPPARISPCFSQDLEGWPGGLPDPTPGVMRKPVPALGDDKPLEPGQIRRRRPAS